MTDRRVIERRASKERSTSRGWLARASFASLALGVAMVVLAPACSLIEPEVGDRITACVDEDSNKAVPVDFARDIRPLLDGQRPPTKGCKNCHYEGVGTQEGFLETQFDMTTLGDLRKGGRNTGASVVVPGSPCKSAIVQKLRGTFGGARMPKEGPYWGDAEIRLLMDWIAEGALGADNL